MPFVYIVACVGALGGMLFGYDTGAISGAILYRKQQFALSATLQEIVTSIALAGVAAGVAAGGALADHYGRRGVIMANATIFILGSLATALAQDVIWLIGGRLFIGAAISIASFVAPLYLSEMTPARIRGTVGKPDVFWLYAALAVCAWLFIWSLVPETKGHTLEEIEAHWQAGKHPREMKGKG